MLSGKVKNWMVGSEWENMDRAIYSIHDLKLLNGAYWFWLMSDYDIDNPRMLQVLISHGPFDYRLNKKRFTNKRVDDKTIICYCGIWQFRDGEISDLVHENCTCSIDQNRLVCITESGHRISISHSFPYYDLQVENDGMTITDFRSSSSEFKEGYFQNPLVRYPSLIAYSDDFDGYARNSRGFQYYLGSKMSDLFGPSRGILFDQEFEGSFWLERSVGFGTPVPWKIIMVNFSDRSRLWYRYFTSRILNYGTPLEFIFDDMATKKRYTFNEMTFHYSGQAIDNTFKFSPDVDTIHITGQGNEGERINLKLKILGRHLYQYGISLLKFNYNQLVLEVEDISIYRDGNDLVHGKTRTLSYGEDAYFSL